VKKEKKEDCIGNFIFFSLGLTLQDGRCPCILVDIISLAHFGEINCVHTYSVHACFARGIWLAANWHPSIQILLDCFQD